MGLRQFLLFLLLSFLFGGPAFAEDDGARLKSFLHDLVALTDAPDSPKKAHTMRALLAADSDLLIKFMDAGERARIIKEAGVGSFAFPQTELDELAKSFSKLGLATWETTGSAERAAMLSAVPDEAIFLSFEAANPFIDAVPYSKLPALGVLVEEIKTVEFPGLSPADLDFLAASFVKYFEKLPPRMKRRMLVAWLALPPDATRVQQLSAVLQNSGPALQKLFQLVGKESTSPALKQITAELLANVKPVPFPAIKAEIEKAYGMPLEEMFLEVSEAPLGTATVGQTHVGKTLAGDPTIIKVIKPGIPEDMVAELDVLREVMAGNAATADLVETLKSNFTAELDLRHEAEQLVAGAIYADPKKGVSVPKPTAGIDAKERVFAMDLAPGKTIGKAKDIDPLVRGQALANVMEKWFMEVMFGGGFFHGDLHPGNMIIEATPGVKPGFKISVIDFGATGKLELLQRKQLLYLFAAVQDGRVDNVLEALKGFGDMSGADQKTLTLGINQIVRNRELSAEEKINRVVGAALRSGAKMNGALVMFSRAGLFLFNEMKAINEEIRIKYPGKRLFNSTEMYVRVGLKSLASEVRDRILQRHGEFVWDSDLLKTVVVGESKYLTRKIGYSCAKFFTALGGAKHP